MVSAPTAGNGVCVINLVLLLVSFTGDVQVPRLGPADPQRSHPYVGVHYDTMSTSTTTTVL